MSYPHSVTLIVRWLAFGVISVDLALTTYILYRRASRNRYYAQKDAARRRCAERIARFLSGDISLGSVLETVQARSRAEREAVKMLVLSGINTSTRQKATGLLFSLGFVEAWARQAFGRHRGRVLLRAIAEGRTIPAAPRKQKRILVRVRRMRLLSLSRAVAVNCLGKLSGDFASVFLAEALQDTCPHVGRLCVAAIGRNHIPDGVPMLLKELRRSVEGETELPVRSIRSALVRYPIQELRHFGPFMDQQSHRLRFLLVDTVREICRKAQTSGLPQPDFPADLRSWFLQKATRDSSPDVRARSAAVIGYLRDPQAAHALRALLQDENEYVRLHSMRACADPYYVDLMADIMGRMSDERWRVREAAAKALAAFETSGRQQMEQFFLSTSDRYASEQIGEEFQRSGLVAQIVAGLGSANGERPHALAVCSKMIRLGMDSLLIETLATDRHLEVRAQLMGLLSSSNAPQFVSILQRIASHELDPLKPRAEALLEARRARAAAAASGGQN